jgi:hypothetical protein
MGIKTNFQGASRKYSIKTWCLGQKIVGCTFYWDHAYLLEISIKRQIF